MGIVTPLAPWGGAAVRAMVRQSALAMSDGEWWT